MVAVRGAPSCAPSFSVLGLSTRAQLPPSCLTAGDGSLNDTEVSMLKIVPDPPPLEYPTRSLEFLLKQIVQDLGVALSIADRRLPCVLGQELAAARGLVRMALTRMPVDRYGSLPIAATPSRDQPAPTGWAVFPKVAVWQQSVNGGEHQ